MADDTKLVEAAMAMRGSAPEAWEQFLHAVREYAAAATADMLRTDAVQLVKQQGVAIGLNQLGVILREAPKTYEARRAKNATR